MESYLSCFVTSFQLHIKAYFSLAIVTSKIWIFRRVFVIQYNYTFTLFISVKETSQMEKTAPSPGIRVSTRAANMAFRNLVEKSQQENMGIYVPWFSSVTRFEFVISIIISLLYSLTSKLSRFCQQAFWKPKKFHRIYCNVFVNFRVFKLYHFS